MRVAMRDIAAWVEKAKQDQNIRMLLQVHDELIFEIKQKTETKAIPKIVNLMENALKGKETHGVPLVADVKVGKTWYDMDIYQT